MSTITLFVRNLPTTASNERLEEIFSDIGPVKHCFVVKEKGAEKCRGFGYVTYAMEVDAQRALKEPKDFDGKKISVSLAKKKINEKKKSGGASKELPLKRVKGKEGKEPEENESAPEAKRLNESAPEAKRLKESAPEAKGLKESAPEAKGLKKNQRKARLIIRNLSFQCSENDLKQTFSKFGTVLEANIPLKPDGKMRGFAFVQMKNMLEAGKALTALNLKKIKGRPVAVDWAVAKDKFVATQPPPSASKEKEAEKPEVDLEPEEKEEEDDKEKKPQKKKKPAATQKMPKRKAPEPEPEVDDSEEEDSEEEDDESCQESDSDLGSEADDDDDDDSDDDEDDEDPKAKRKPLPSDVDQGRTVFIRNLSFDTEEEGLEEALLKFGELSYVKIVINPDTERSKGMAFAQFKEKEAAVRCIASSAEESESGGIRVDGRRLIVVAAVSREDAVKLKSKKVKVNTGTRNLYLAREGLIRVGTKAAEGVSEADLAKRTRFEELKRAKLRDIGVFVSKTRLCVHNLPKSVDNKQLRKLCLRAAGGGKGVQITECRVMYDRKPEGGKVLGRSLGYSFVQFREHEHALKTLRHLNNNPDIFGPAKRPIVEFSLEDGKKLKMKELRQQQNQQRNIRRGVAPGAGKPFQPQPQKHGGGATQQGVAGGPQLASGTKQYMGFSTRPEVEHVELGDGKKRRSVLLLPSHRGPKIRKRDKGKQQPVQPTKPLKRPSRRDRLSSRPLEKPSGASQPRIQVVKTAKRRLKTREDDRFDKLVDQYKSKLMGTSKANVVKKSKWFS